LTIGKPISSPWLVAGVCAIVIWLWVSDREPLKNFILEFS